MRIEGYKNLHYHSGGGSCRGYPTMQECLDDAVRSC